MQIALSMPNIYRMDSWLFTGSVPTADAIYLQMVWDNNYLRWI